MTIPLEPEVAWATPGDVKLLTGAVATMDEIVRAQALIELFAGTTIEASNVGNVSTRNRRMLRMAVAYQTAWMQEHPDVFTAMDTTGMDDGGQYRTDNAGFLAPMADRCLNRLTWRLRPWRVRPGVGAPPAPDFGSRESAAADDDRPWSPM